MSSSLRRSILAVTIACLGAPGVAAAAPHIRTGLCVGGGFGIESLTYTDQYDEKFVEGSGTANARIAYALKPDLMLGVEFWGWANE